MITEKDVWSFLHRVAEDDNLSKNVNPRDVEEPNLCLYSDNGKHCLVGYWFANEVGVDDTFFQHIEGAAADNAIATAIELGVIEAIEPLAVDTLTLVQEYADAFDREYDFTRGLTSVMPTTWGEAIAKIFGE
jgi:hypothetical protein